MAYGIVSYKIERNSFKLKNEKALINHAKTNTEFSLYLDFFFPHLCCWSALKNWPGMVIPAL